MHDAEKYSEDDRVTNIKYMDLLIDFNRLVQLRIANTAKVAILKKGDLTSLKRKMDVTL